jgi:hypothetical protein
MRHHALREVSDGPIHVRQGGLVITPGRPGEVVAGQRDKPAHLRHHGE